MDGGCERDLACSFFPAVSESQENATESAPPAPASDGFLGPTFGAFFGQTASLLLLGALACSPHALAIWLRNGIPFASFWIHFGFGVLHLLVTGVGIGVVVHHLANRRCDVGEMGARSLLRLPAMLVSALLSTLMVLGLLSLGMLAARHAGMLALFVVIATIIICAGLSAALRISVATAFIEGRSGIGSIARSLSLTRGRRLRIFGAEMILGLALTPLSMLLDTLQPGTLPYAATEVAFGAASFAFSAAFSAVVYVRLRERSDGSDPQAIAESL